MQDLPIDIHSIMFRPDDRVEITYAEKREQNETIAVIRTVVVERREFEQDFDDMEQFALDVLDEAVKRVRNPPETLPARSE